MSSSSPPSSPPAKGASGGGLEGGQQQEEQWLIEPHDVYPSWIVFGVFSVCLGVGMFVIMAMLLAAQTRLECSGLRVIGGVFLPMGAVVAVLGGLALKYRAIQPRAAVPPAGWVLPVKIVCGVLICVVYVIFVLLCVLGATVYIMRANTADIRLSREDVPGLSGRVYIDRDGHGVPHVNAASVNDALFAQGYLIAQDRLAQLEVLRLAANGNLAKYTGSDDALDIDKAVRGSGMKTAAELSCAEFDAATALSYQRYADGVNYFLEEDGSRPPEFMFLGQLLIFHEPEPFTREDLCRVVTLQQWQIARNPTLEAQRWDLYANLGWSYDDVNDMWPVIDTPDDALFNNSFAGFTAADSAARAAKEALDDALERRLYEEVMGRYREAQPATNARRQGASGGDESSAQSSPGRASRRRRAGQRRSGLEKLTELVNLGSEIPMQVDGSNAWATRAAGGAAILSSDPHLQTSLPSFWYPLYVHIRGTAPAHHYGGVSVPGLVGLMIGKTADVAWGVTISYTDFGDLYVMEPDPARPATHYMHNGQSRAYTYRTETIEVMGKDDYVMRVKESVYGSDVAEAWDLSRKHVICLSSRMTEVDRTTHRAMLNIIKPGVVTSAARLRTEVMQHIQSPGLSLTIADRFGAIGYAVTGAHRVRAPGHTGRFPVLGNGSYDYVRNVTWAETPGFTDTGSYAFAFHVNNNRISAPGDPVILTREFVEAGRWRSTRAALHSAPTSSWSSAAFNMAVQTNETSGAWLHRLRAVLDPGQPTGAVFHGELNAAGRAMWDRLAAWDGVSTMGATAPSELWTWLWEMGQLPQQALGHLEVSSQYPSFYPSHLIINPSPASEARCRAAAGSPASCVHYAAAVFNRVAASDAQTKRWGQDLSRQELRHFVAHGTAIECMFSRKLNKGGDPNSISPKWIPRDAEEGVLGGTSGASMRFIVDWSTPDQFYFSMPGGASGTPFSEYYTNFAQLWAENRYAVIRIDGAESHAHISLEP